MTAFPTDFSAAIRSPQNPYPVLRGDANRFRWFPRLIRPDVRAAALLLLETHLSPHLRLVRSPVDPALIANMTRNYSEALPKSLRNHTAMLNDPRSAASKAAKAIGLTAFLTSPSLKDFAERVSGFELAQSPGLQVICYHPGDYVGPHNDHHPEEPHLRDGYVDLQITLTNDDVAHQSLLYENGGLFNEIVDIAIPSGVSVSHLPFWHQVTPLQPRRGREATARRWLLLASFVRR
jgi:hypothetical protein